MVPSNGVLGNEGTSVERDRGGEEEHECVSEGSDSERKADFGRTRVSPLRSRLSLVFRRLLDLSQAGLAFRQDPFCPIFTLGFVVDSAGVLIISELSEFEQDEPSKPDV